MMKRFIINVIGHPELNRIIFAIDLDDAMKIANSHCAGKTYRVFEAPF